MKKSVFIILSVLLCFCCCLSIKPVFVSASATTNQEKSNMPKKEFTKPKASLLAIVIDDFGGWERTGVKELLESDIPITCAIMPFVDNSQQDYIDAIKNGKEVILHMPMQANVSLPTNWYGTVYIENNESKESAIQKLQKCLDTMPEAKGFNIHIGSGACQNVELMQHLYEYADKHNMFFLDSRTINADKCEEACQAAKSIYLGRDVFLEPNDNRSHYGVTQRISQGVALAKEKGYAIVIGHVGAEGGLNTARAILDYKDKFESEGVKVVPLSQIYQEIKNQ